MKIRWRGKTYIFGRKAKAAYLAKKAENAAAIKKFRHMVSQPATDHPIDFAKEFESFSKGLGSVMTRPMSPRERIITVTSLIAEELRFLITLKMAASTGTMPSKSAINAVFEGSYVLASFGDRISYCAAFGLLPNDIKGDIGILKDLRNKLAAHSFDPLSFDDPAVASRCQDLTLKMSVKEVDDLENENEKRFLQSSWVIVIALLSAAFVLQEQQKALNALSATIERNAITRINESIFKKMGPSGMEVPPEPSPDKSA